jgi:methionyl-tRNA formyltransferase
MALRFDSGDILAQETAPLDGTETTGTLTERLASVGARVLASVLTRLRDGDVPGRAQREEDATYCHLIRKEDGRIDWSAPTAVIERMVRAYDPWPRANSSFAGQTLLVLKSRSLPDTLSAAAGGARPPGVIIGSSPQSGLLVQTGDGILAVERLQLQFKKPLDWRSFLNGHPDAIGTRLGG